nr:unnamed protein product [Callosobruchus analis]
MKYFINFQVFRHGDRSPLESCPNDKYSSETYWPMGVGQLLNVNTDNTIVALSGYNLFRSDRNGRGRGVAIYARKNTVCSIISVDTKGFDELWLTANISGQKYLRERYKTFLSDQYKHQEIHVMSSDIDRTIMSAELVLAGMYPPTKEDVWLEGFPWQPIPVHSIQTDKDNFIDIKRECLKGSLLIDAAESEVLGLLRKTYPDIFRSISQNSGWSEIGESDLRHLVNTMDIYKKFTPSFVPEWYAELDPQSLSYIAGACFELPTHTKQLQRLSSGPLFNRLINHLDGAIKGEKHKFLMISGHDTTVSPLLDTIDCFEYKAPEPASSAILKYTNHPMVSTTLTYYIKKALKLKQSQ